MTRRLIFQPVMETPISLPIPNVMAAAANPKITCLKPENHTFLPVNKVIADPIKNNPVPLIHTLKMIAFIPLVIIKGITGITAPMAKRMKE